MECVVNLSEGRDGEALADFVSACGPALLDVHRNPDHNRSVFTLEGPHVVEAALELSGSAVRRLDLNRHSGVHPRLGVVDVVPFVPIGDADLGGEPDLSEALAARATFAREMAARYGVPCFFYGPERTLPDVRRTAYRGLAPDVGPLLPHPSAGSCCVGARGVLVAYNLVISGSDHTVARNIARAIRGPAVRALGFQLHGRVQVSCNLIDPMHVGIEATYDAVDRLAHEVGSGVIEAELVGLMPMRMLDDVPRRRWSELGVSLDQTIEWRRASRPPV